MYTINIYEENSLLQSFSSNLFNLSIRKQESTVYASIRTEVDIVSAITYINQLIPKLESPITVELVVNNKVVLSYQSKILSDISTDGINGSSGINFTIRMN